MLLLKKCIKKQTAPLCLTKFIYEKNACIALSYGTRIEIHSYVNEHIKTINVNSAALLLTYAFKREDETLFVVSADNTFSLIKNDKIIQKGALFDEYKHEMRPLSLFRTDSLIVILFTHNKIVLANQKDKKIIINNLFNYYNNYEIKDIKERNNKIFLLIKDLDKKIYVSNLMVKLNSSEIFYANIENLPAETEKIAFYKNKLILFMNNSIGIFEDNKLEYETNFANTNVIHSVELENNLLLFMENGEIIDIHVSDTIFINEIYKFKDKIVNVINLEAGLFFGVLLFKGEIYFKFTDRIQILDKRKETKLLKLHENFRIQTEKNEKICKFQLKTEIKHFINMESKIKKIWAAKNFLFISSSDKTLVYDLMKKEFVKEFDGVKNVKKIKKEIKLNTNNLIITLTESNQWIFKESDTILLSDYYKQSSLFYHGDKITLYERNTLIGTTKVPLNISFVLITDFIFLSSLDSVCYFYDLNLQFIYKCKFHSLVSYISSKNNFYFLTIQNEIYQIKKENFLPIKKIKKKLIYKNKTYTDNFIKAEGCILINGKNPKIINLKNKLVYDFYNKEITDLTQTKENIFISSEENIYFCEKKFYKNSKLTKLPKVKEVKIDKKRIIYKINDKEIFSLKLKENFFNFFIVNDLILVSYNSKEYSQLILYKIKEGIKEIYKVTTHSSINKIINYKEIILVDYFTKFVIYKVKKNELIKENEYFLEYFTNPHYIINDKFIFMYDKKSNLLLQLENENIKEIYKFNIKSIELSVFYKDCLLIYNEKFFVIFINLKDFRVKSITQIESEFISFVEHKINQRSIYYLTNYNEIGLITKCKFNTKEKKALILIYNFIKEKFKSNHKFERNFIDLDLILHNWDDKFIKEVGLEDRKVKCLIEKCERMF